MCYSNVMMFGTEVQEFLVAEKPLPDAREETVDAMTREVVDIIADTIRPAGLVVSGSTVSIFDDAGQAFIRVEVLVTRAPTSPAK